MILKKSKKNLSLQRLKPCSERLYLLNTSIKMHPCTERTAQAILNPLPVQQRLE
jgi:hypothetical protein